MSRVRLLLEITTDVEPTEDDWADMEADLGDAIQGVCLFASLAVFDFSVAVSPWAVRQGLELTGGGDAPARS